MAKKEKKPDGKKITVVISDKLDKRYEVVKKSGLPANIIYKGLLYHRILYLEV